MFVRGPMISPNTASMLSCLPSAASSDVRSGQAVSLRLHIAQCVYHDYHRRCKYASCVYITISS